MSFDTQHMYKNLGMVPLPYNPSVKKVETAEPLRLTLAGSLANQ